MELKFTDPPDDAWSEPMDDLAFTPATHTSIGIQLARAKLNAPAGLPSVWPLVAASALAAASSLGLVAAIIIGLPKL